jgi:hypothetical protein
MGTVHESVQRALFLSVSKCLGGLCNFRSRRIPRPLAASAPLQLLGRSRRATSPLRVAFRPLLLPMGLWQNQQSPTLLDLAFGRAVLLTRADGLEVPHYFSAYVICGGTACAVQILSQVRGACNKVVKMWLILGKWCVFLCRTITRERWMKAKMTTNPRVSVHQCIPWVSAQVPNVSKPTSSGWRPQTKLSKYGYFPYNDRNVMGSLPRGFDAHLWDLS